MLRLVLLPALLLAGCGATTTRAPEPEGAAASRAATPASELPATPMPPPAAPALEPARCAAGKTNCTAHTGRVLTVESVDSDGDGDLHVIATGGSVTAPGITVFDVSRALRPARDPQPGDRVTGSGPVYRGSFRQRQIEVRTFRVARASG